MIYNIYRYYYIWSALEVIGKKMHHENERPVRTGLSATTVTIRHAHNAVDAERLLRPSVLDRLCHGDMPNRVRQRDVYVAHVIVAFVGKSAVGFTAYQTTTGSVRVAHEFCVDLRARVGLAPVTDAILTRLEFVVRAAGCSRLVVVLPESTPLRRLLEKSGYRVSLGSAGPSWFEKRLVDEGPPLESA